MHLGDRVKNNTMKNNGHNLASIRNTLFLIDKNRSITPNGVSIQPQKWTLA